MNALKIIWPALVVVACTPVHYDGPLGVSHEEMSCVANLMNEQAPAHTPTVTVSDKEFIREKCGGGNACYSFAEGRIYLPHGYKPRTRAHEIGHHVAGPGDWLTHNKVKFAANNYDTWCSR